MKNNLLPANAYTDNSFYAKEQQQLFSNCWTYVCLNEDLTEPGQYITVQAGLNNLIVYRDTDGTLTALHNICRHRGMRLLEGKGKLGNKISCPYHDWTYDVKGNLLGLPKQQEEFNGLDKSCYSIKPASADSWRGMIWVHADPSPLSLQTYFEPVAAYLAPYDVDSLIESEEDIQVEEINANWKLVVENYIDHYHLAQLHAGTLNMYDHKNAEFGFAGEHFYFWEPLSPDYQKDIEKNSVLPLLIDPQHARLGTFVHMLFPCVGLAESESSWSVFNITPVSAAKTRIEIRTKVKNCSSFSFMTQFARSSSFWDKKIRPKSQRYDEKHPLGSADFLLEDIFVCEQLQKSLTSPAFEFGPSAEHGESPVRGFQQLIINKLQL